MHHQYHTESFILKAEPRGEANMLFTLLSAELGLVRAQATSVRQLKSKLRYTLQPYTWANVSLVKGKGMWRITTASSLEELPQRLTWEGLSVFARISRLLERLIQGEEANQEIYDVVKGGYVFLDNGSVDKETLDNLEHLLVLRILYSLGYIGDNDSLKYSLSTTEFDAVCLEDMQKFRDVALGEINNALRASQL